MRWISTRRFLILVVLLAAAAMWLFRPWSPFSPYEMIVKGLPEAQPETLRALDRILPYRLIRARAPADTFPRREAPLDVFYEWGGERRSSERFLEETQTTGVFVLHEGAIVHERYRLGETPEDRHGLFGVADGVVALMIARALEDGRIASLEDAVETHARVYRGSSIGALRLADLLDDPSALPLASDGAASSSLRDVLAEVFVPGRNPDRMILDTVRAQEREALRAARDAETRRSDEALLGASDAARPPREPAPRAAVSQVLAAVVRGAYDASMVEAVEAALWDPVGMNDDGSWSQHVSGGGGVAVTACCMAMTLRDFARLGEALRRNSAPGAEPLAPEGWLDAAAVGDAASTEDDPWMRVRGGWTPRDGGGELVLAGAYGQYLWIDRRRRTVIAITGADPEWRARRGEATVFLRAAVDAVAD